MAESTNENISLNEKVNIILSDRAEVNNIVDIIEQLDSDDPAVVVGSIAALGKIFTSFLKSGECSTIGKGKSAQNIGHKRKRNAKEPEEIFRTWLTCNYGVTVKKLLKLVHSPDQEFQELSLSTLMGFLRTESQILRGNFDGYIFPNDFFFRIVTSMTSGSRNMENLIKFFKQYMYLQCTDIRYYVLKNLCRIVSKFLEADQQSKKGSVHFCRNVYHLLRRINVLQSEDDMRLFSTPDGDDRDTAPVDHSVTNVASHKKVFTGAWTSFLNLSLDAEVHRQVLVILHEKVMPHLLDPKVLMDFLVDSFDIGGVTSILSLNSLFVLVHQYNLDYPDFYKKLYSLFDVEIFHLKYRGRFFYLADLFLTSTHIPAYLVAAFIKRLSRLALRAPPSGVALVVAFVGNLIRRHPNCKVLIHRKKDTNVTDKDSKETSNTLTDPFIEDETDPGQCRALQSSLWELGTLRHHYYPGIKSLVELLEKPISKNETDVSEYFDSSYESLFEDECVELTKNNAFVEFHTPKGLFSDTMKELWHVGN